ncbi:MAG: mandelate racemase/muconate lactonizing enzyme family protein [Chloroflexi bacterium]|nr:mandelate racemase/muconate lactonizing enzyme family protein [Chloroflexota bacterium]
MKITQCEVLVLGDPPPPERVEHRIAGLAVLRLHTDEGLIGLSEVFAVPPGVVKAVLDGPDSLFGAQLIGEDPFPPERLWSRLYNAMLHGNRRGWAVICIGAVDVALWDLCGKALGRPVWQLLGAPERSRYQIASEQERRYVAPYCTIISLDYDRESVLRQQVERVERLRDLGYRAFKVEPMRSAPETVVELARLAREAIGPDRMLAVDVGYLWNDVGQAAKVCEQLLEYDIYWLETPFPVDSLEAYARLSRQTRLRLAAGEHTVTRWEFLDLLDRGGVLVAQPYMTTCGGLTEARRIVELAQPRGALVCPGNWSTQLLGAASVHLAAISPVTPYIEYAPSEVYWSPLLRAIQELALPVVDGRIAFPSAPGMGVELPDDLLAHFRVG